MDFRAVCVAALMAAVALAGCTNEAGGPIRIVSQPDDASSEPLVLESTVNADEYVWDMGDGRAKLTGQRIEHTYGVSDGSFTVKLTTVSGGEETKHDPLRIVFGSGTNAAPELVMALEWQWVQVGEAFTISGQTSSDPDGDPLLYDFFCQRVSEIALAGAGHAHDDVGGIQYGSGNANAIPVVALNGTNVPDATREVSGDFCSGMAQGAFSEDGSIRGAFEQDGLYEVTMMAKDPAHPALPGVTTIYVTDTPRQSPWSNLTFEGDIEFGVPEAGDGPSEQLGMQDHIVSHTFDVKYPTKAVKASLSNDDGDGVPAEITYEVRKGSSVKVPATSEPLDKGEDFLSPGSYTVVIALRQGSNVHYTFDVELLYETTPGMIFEGPH